MNGSLLPRLTIVHSFHRISPWVSPVRSSPLSIAGHRSVLPSNHFSGKIVFEMVRSRSASIPTIQIYSTPTGASKLEIAETSKLSSNHKDTKQKRPRRVSWATSFSRPILQPPLILILLCSRSQSNDSFNASDTRPTSWLFL